MKNARKGREMRMDLRAGRRGKDREKAYKENKKKELCERKKQEENKK